MGNYSRFAGMWHFLESLLTPKAGAKISGLGNQILQIIRGRTQTCFHLLSKLKDPRQRSQVEHVHNYLSGLLGT